jgi:predicted transcriptional regulator YdeE/DNA-binding transcriptional MerR regulator
MLKIGDFSKLAHVTVKALRHYARLGLLQPVWTDRLNGYRYYSLDQLPRLNRILALKEMGFSLYQVRELLDAELPPIRLRQLFDQKQQELHQKLEAEQTRLNRVAERLAWIEYEGCLPEYEVAIKSIPALPVISMRAMVPVLRDLPDQCLSMHQMIDRWCTSAGLPTTGSWMVLYHNPEYYERNLDIQIAVLLERQVRLRERQRSKAIEMTLLPAVASMASLLQPAAGQVSEPSYTALYTWIERNRFHVSGPARELYLSDPEALQTQASGESTPGASLIEIQIPVESNQIYQQKYIENPYRKENEMEPKFVSLPAFTVVGLRYYGKNQNQEISAMWGDANKRFGELKNISEDAAYGICFAASEGSNGEFEYVASLKVDSEEDIPEGMVVRHIPAARYAVFTHIGSLDKLKDTYNYIYQTWVPQSGMQLVGNLDFEYYNQDFNDFAPDSRFYIYVPVKE